MPRAKRTCSDHTDGVNCPRVATNGTRCDPHAAAYEAGRGARQVRGYDARHDRERLKWVPRVMAGKVDCWRCGDPIAPGEEWDLGHDDTGASRGPEHRRRCNRRAAGRKAHGLEWTRNGPQTEV